MRSKEPSEGNQSRNDVQLKRLSCVHHGARRFARFAGALILALGLFGAVIGCTSQQGSNTGGNASPAADGPTTVTDAYGRNVVIPTQITSIATVGSGARFVVYAGAQDKLIAVTQMETEASPGRPYTVAWQDLFASLPATSEGNHLMETSVDTEALLGLAPDLIISSRSAQECDTLQEQLGIPVVGISYQDQLFSDDVYTSILVVGKAAGTSEHAEAVVEALKGWAADLDARTASIPDAERPSCYTGAVNYKGAKSFAGTYAHYAPFEAVHAVNVADETGQTGSVQIDLEQLGTWDPDYLFLNMGNKNLMEEDYEKTPAFFDALTAFKKGNLYSQPSFNYNGTNIETGICNAYFIGATIYPDAFADVDLEAKYEEIFTTMLGTPAYEQMKAAGMRFGSVVIGK